MKKNKEMVEAAKTAAFKATIPPETLTKYQDKLVIRVIVAMSKLGGTLEEKPERPVSLDRAINFLSNAPKFGFYVASVYFEDGSELVFEEKGFKREKIQGCA